VTNPDIRQDFEALERYVTPIVERNAYSKLSREESMVLALQCINRINQIVGRAARSSKDESGSLRLLQAKINSVTIALKNDNLSMLRGAMGSLRSFVEEPEPKST
jgi:hypothetical protein